EVPLETGGDRSRVGDVAPPVEAEVDPRDDEAGRPVLHEGGDPQLASCGRSFKSERTPRLTQSVGVPSTAYQFSCIRCMRSGRVRVRACPVALCSRSGATTITSAISDSDAARSLIPSEKMPSSLVTRMRVKRGLGCPGRLRRGA